MRVNDVTHTFLTRVCIYIYLYLCVFLFRIHSLSLCLSQRVYYLHTGVFVCAFVYFCMHYCVRICVRTCFETGFKVIALLRSVCQCCFYVFEFVFYVLCVGARV